MQKCAVVVKQRNRYGYITDTANGAKQLTYEEWLNNANSLPKDEAYRLATELKTMGFYAFVIIKNVKEIMQ